MAYVLRFHYWYFITNLFGSHPNMDLKLKKKQAWPSEGWTKKNTFVHPLWLEIQNREVCQTKVILSVVTAESGTRDRRHEVTAILVTRHVYENKERVERNMCVSDLDRNIIQAQTDFLRLMIEISGSYHWKSLMTSIHHDLNYVMR